MMDPHSMGGMEVCQPAAGGANANAGQGTGVPSAGGADSTPLSQAAPGHRDRTLVYSTVGTPDYIAPEVSCARLLSSEVARILEQRNYWLNRGW